MAPVTPFIVEHMFQNLKRIAPKEQRVDSVHYLMLPQPIEGASNPAIESAVTTMQNIINGGACSSSISTWRSSAYCTLATGPGKRHDELTWRLRLL